MFKRFEMFATSAAAIVLAACATTTPLPPPPAPADAEIAAIAMAANRGSIEEAELARSSAASQAVRDFASMMVQHHTEALDQERAWAANASVSPMENDSSRALTRNSEQSVSALRQYSGAAFDRAYMQRQIAMHRYLLSGIDQVLLPRATDPTLRAHLEQIRGGVQSHLTEAQRIMSGLPS